MSKKCKNCQKLPKNYKNVQKPAKHRQKCLRTIIKTEKCPKKKKIPTQKSKNQKETDKKNPKMSKNR